MKVQSRPVYEEQTSASRARRMVAQRADSARDAIANVSVLELEFEAPPVHRRRMIYPQLHQGRDWLAEHNAPQA
jgi:hypothetical protein